MPDKKKKEEKLEILKEQENIEELVRKYKEKEKKKRKEGVEATEAGKFSVESREYEEFRTGMGKKEAKTLYEKACRICGKLLTIKQKPEAEEKINETLYFIGYNVTASEVRSLGVVGLILFVVAAGAVMAL